MALTGKRDLFCREYLKDLNAKQAALRAGYSNADAGKEGHRLLADELVQQHIAALAAERNQELKIEARDVLLELLRIASVDPSPMLEDNGAVKSIHDIPIDIRRTIASVDIEEIYERIGEKPDREKVEVGRVKKIKFWNKNAALEALGRHLALFKDVIEHRFDGGAPPADIEVAAKCAAILEAARREAKEIAALV